MLLGPELARRRCGVRFKKRISDPFFLGSTVARSAPWLFSLFLHLEGHGRRTRCVVDAGMSCSTPGQAVRYVLRLPWSPAATAAPFWLPGALPALPALPTVVASLHAQETPPRPSLRQRPSAKHQFPLVSTTLALQIKVHSDHDSRGCGNPVIATKHNRAKLPPFHDALAAWFRRGHVSTLEGNQTQSCKVQRKCPALIGTRRRLSFYGARRDLTFSISSGLGVSGMPVLHSSQRKKDVSVHNFSGFFVGETWPLDTRLRTNS